MYCKSAVFSFWKPTSKFFELHTNLTKEMYKNRCHTLSFVQLLMREAGKETVKKYYIVFIVKSEDAIMNDCKHLKFKDN